MKTIHGCHGGHGRSLAAMVSHQQLDQQCSLQARMDSTACSPAAAMLAFIMPLPLAGCASTFTGADALLRFADGLPCCPGGGVRRLPFCCGAAAAPAAAPVAAGRAAAAAAGGASSAGCLTEGRARGTSPACSDAADLMPSCFASTACTGRPCLRSALDHVSELRILGQQKHT